MAVEKATPLESGVSTSQRNNNTTTIASPSSRHQQQQQQHHKQSSTLLKRLFGALCCISERDEESLKDGGSTALTDLPADERRYEETNAPKYESETEPNDKRILDKPVPPIPESSGGSGSGSGSQPPAASNSSENTEESIVRRAETSVQSPINVQDAAEKLDPDHYADSIPEEEESPQWLLKPLSKDLQGRKCLVLDLDETLVHSSFKFIHQADFVIPVEIENQFHNVYVIKRPGVDEFMKRVGELFEIVVFTASVSKYGDPLLDQLDIHNAVHHRLFRESCYNHQGNYIKNLSQLGRALNDVIIIDNSPASYIFHPQHAVPVSSWFSDAHDNELLDMIPFLEDLAQKSVDDVSMVLDVNI